jgi:hypothetical protein
VEGDFVGHFKRIDAQNQRTIKILLVIITLVLIDGFNRYYSGNQYLDRLPITLYDFTERYKNVLVQWYSTQDKENEPHSDSVVIHVEKRYRIDQTLTDGYHDVSEIPLLEAYLSDHLPQLSGNKDFFGYRLSFPIYFVVVLFSPTSFLIYVFFNIIRMKRLWNQLETDSARMVLDLPTFPLAKTKKTFRLTLETCGFGLFLFTISLLPSFVFIAWYQLLPIIKGTLYVIPLAIPVLDSTYSWGNFRASDFELNAMLILMLINLFTCILIIKILLSPKVSSKAKA